MTTSMTTTPQHYPESLFQALPHQQQELSAIFLKLKGVRSHHTKRLYTRELAKFLWWLHQCGHTHIDEYVLFEYQDTLLNPPQHFQPIPDLSFTAIPVQTLDQYFKVIRSYCRYLYDKGALAYNPATLVPNRGISQVGHDKPRHLAPEQWQAVLQTLQQLPESTPGQANRKARLQFCIRFQYAMALRVFELEQHTHADIRSHGGALRLYVVGKGKKARTIPLDNLAIDALHQYRSYLGLSPIPNGEPLPLLPSVSPVQMRTRGPNKGFTVNAKGVTSTNWQQIFKTFIKQDVVGRSYPPNQRVKEYEKNWSHIVPHSLRHTRITDLARAGKDLLWLQRFAGHENINTTSLYYHL